MNNSNELLITIHTVDNKCYIPVVEDNVNIEYYRKGQPSKITFKVVQDELLDIQEGYRVKVQRGDLGIFFGFVFKRNLDKDNILSIIAYDQLRYLKNEQIYNTVNKKASEIIKQLAEDFQLTIGDIADTEYVIPRFRAGKQTLFDLMQTAIDITTEATKNLYVLYDDYGKLTLKNINDMRVDILIDSETAENFSFTSDIDKDTYNDIVLYFDNKDTNAHEISNIAMDTKTIAKWGLLRKIKSVNPEKPINLDELAKTMLKRYNRVRRTLSIKNAFGDDRVRGGSSIFVKLYIDKQEINMKMLVESVKHTYTNNSHFMDLTLKGEIFE